MLLHKKLLLMTFGTTYVFQLLTASWWCYCGV